MHVAAEALQGVARAAFQQRLGEVGRRTGTARQPGNPVDRLGPDRLGRGDVARDVGMIGEIVDRLAGACQHALDDFGRLRRRGLDSRRIRFERRMHKGVLHPLAHGRSCRSHPTHDALGQRRP